MSDIKIIDCEFCSVLMGEPKNEFLDYGDEVIYLDNGQERKIHWAVRSIFADDNSNKYINGNEERTYHQGFKLSGWMHEGNVIVGIDYWQEITDKDGKSQIVHPFSEGVQWNFCPICGKQISKDIRKWKEYYSHQIEIE